MVRVTIFCYLMRIVIRSVSAVPYLWNHPEQMPWYEKNYIKDKKKILRFTFSFFS